MIMLSTFSIKCSKIANLVEILLPPTIAVTGLIGFFKTLLSISISFCIDRPATDGKNEVMPRTDEWALWEHEKASLTKTSAIADSPITSEATIILGSFKYCFKILAIGDIDSSGMIFPFGLPRWLPIIKAAPLLNINLIVGIASRILISLIIFPSIKGTLKSTLKKTFFPVISI